MFNKDAEKTQLSDAAKMQLSRLVSSRWLWASSEIASKITDSREGWDFYLKNAPNASVTASLASDRLDQQDVQDRQTKGFRLGTIPKIVNAVTAYIINSVFPADERFFRATPKNEHSETYQEYYEKSLAERFAQANVVEEFKKFVTTAAIDPLACAVVHWKQKKGRKITYKPKTIIDLGILQVPVPIIGGLIEEVDDNAILWEGTCIETLDINDWRIDPYCKNPNESWFIRRWYEPVWKVKKDYDFADATSYNSAWSDTATIEKYQLNGLRKPIDDATEPDGKERALLMAMYDDFELDGKVYENHCVVVANGYKVVWFGPNPYNHGRKPVLFYTFNPIPGQSYGYSQIHHALPSAALSDVCASSLVKIGTWAAKPVFEVDMHEPVFKRGRAVKPGMTIPVRRPGQALRQVPINVQNLTILADLMEKAEQNLRETTGTSKMLLGEEFQQPANITAFQVDQHLQGTGNLFQNYIKTFNNLVLEPLLVMAWENDRQYKTMDEYIDFSGDEPNVLTPDIIKQTDFSWTIMSAQAVNNKARRLANIQMILTQLVPGMIESGVAELSNRRLQIDIPSIWNQLMSIGGEPMADKYAKVVEGGMQNGIPALNGGGIGPGGGAPGQLPPVPTAQGGTVG